MPVIEPVQQVGLDAKIYRIQTYLDSYFADIWQGTISIYGRLYETVRKDKKVLEAYISGKDYKEVFVNDKEVCTIGFVELSRSIENRVLKAKLNVIITGNIKSLLLVDTRKDELLFLQIYKGLHKSLSIETISNPKRGIDDVFSGFDTEKIKFRDMQPWFCFSFEIEVQYNENIC